MARFSDSIANSGLQNIGAVTWRNAMAAMADESEWLCSDLEALHAYFAGFGAWERAELEAMSGQELNALLVQFIAGEYQNYTDAREQGRKAFREYRENQGGSLYGHRGRWFYLASM
jgi:hypothetical protein